MNLKIFILNLNCHTREWEPQVCSWCDSFTPHSTLPSFLEGLLSPALSAARLSPPSRVRGEHQPSSAGSLWLGVFPRTFSQLSLVMPIRGLAPHTQDTTPGDPYRGKSCQPHHIPKISICPASQGWRLAGPLCLCPKPHKTLLFHIHHFTQSDSNTIFHFYASMSKGTSVIYHVTYVFFNVWNYYFFYYYLF